jgi:hypothetical protein
VAGIGAGEEVAIDVEIFTNAVTDFVMAADGLLSLGLTEFEALAELLEGVGDCNHQR